MAVKLRLTRMGRRHRPFFRLNAIDAECPRDGRILEKLGHYDPLEKDAEKQIVLKKERIEHWLGLGAVPSETVANILVKNDIKCKWLEELKARRAKAKAIAKAKGKPFDKAQKIAAVKAAEAKATAAAEAKAAKEAKAKAAEEAAAAKAAEAEAVVESPAEEAAGE